ncbi:MAG TPA: response regulator transcription factor [Blastocatellia bacterium]|nr:response regulator transcription factor [Blastocatellia bacterium]
MMSEVQPISRKVWVIEDERLTYTLLQHLLERRGFEVELATDGRQAGALLNEQKPPELILLDLMLPYTDGFELIADIRQKPGWQEVPIIVLTGKVHERDVVRALEVGAHDYVTKPFQPEELMARVRRFTK